MTKHHAAGTDTAGAHETDAEDYAAALTANRGHVPVMIDRITDLLRPAVEAAGPDAVLVDATLGAGGHTLRLLEEFPQLNVIGLDRDTQALGEACERLARFGGRFEAYHTRFDGLGEVADGLRSPWSPGEIDDAAPDDVAGPGTVARIAAEHGLAGVLFDLGVSSMQLDRPERGFAYRVDAPLDMRMDQSGGMTAADVLNTYDHGRLAHVLKTYGDERFAGKIASAVLREREREPFTTSGRLVELLYETIPAPARRTGGHPAKRTFQALRVEVNGELDALEAAIPAATDRLRAGGRAVFMSYQSLEDRIVKHAVRELTTSTTPPGLPVDLPGTAPDFRAVTHGAEKADEAETAANPRAASVRVRALERLNPEGETR